MVKAYILADQVYDHLLAEILAGELPAGTPLRELEVARRLGVSRTPIREALARLVQYGVVENKPNHVAVVCRFGRDELMHIYQVREALEGMATELACGRLTAADFTHLEALSAAALETGESPEYLNGRRKFDAALHATVASRSGNPILARDIPRLHSMAMLIHYQLELALLGQHRLDVEARKQFRQTTWQQHQDILAALKAGDAQASRRLMIGHLRDSCRGKICLLSETSLPAAGAPGQMPQAAGSGDQNPPVPVLV